MPWTLIIRNHLFNYPLGKALEHRVYRWCYGKDPKIIGPRNVFGVTRVVGHVFLNTPVVIFLACNDNMVFPDLQGGICGQNMNLAAKSLGLGFCWSRFGTAVNFIPAITSKLGFDLGFFQQS